MKGWRLAAALSLLGLQLVFAAPSRAATKPIPAPPRYYVLDEPHVLDPRSLRSLETLLIEHDRLTGEQFLIAVFNGLDGEDAVDWTNRVFSAWKIGQRGKDNGILLALYWKDHQARIEVGYGFEDVLTDAKSKHVISDILTPELRAGHPARALDLAALEILRIIESPLVNSDKAEQILRGGGLQGSLQPAQPAAGSWWVWVFLGGILFVIVMNLLTSAEAHFTSMGWYRPRPWQKRRWGGGGFGGFGGFGGWGGGDSGWGGGGSGGGFMGGGGSSGGGGASGSW